MVAGTWHRGAGARFPGPESGTVPGPVASSAAAHSGHRPDSSTVCPTSVKPASAAFQPPGACFDRPAFHLHAAPARAADQVVVVHAGAALAVERLAAGITDGVDVALLAEHLQVPVDGGQADVLALAPQLGVDVLGAAEARQGGQRGGQRLRLPGPWRARVPRAGAQGAWPASARPAAA